jgi:hypothetical protein
VPGFGHGGSQRHERMQIPNSRLRGKENAHRSDPFGIERRIQEGEETAGLLIVTTPGSCFADDRMFNSGCGQQFVQ